LLSELCCAWQFGLIELHFGGIRVFCDIKNELDNPVVRMIMGESAFDNSPEAMDYKVAEFRRSTSIQKESGGE